MIEGKDTGDVGREEGPGSASGPKPPVVLLSSIRWGWLWQRHQALAVLFAQAGYPTVFVETTGIANPTLNRVTFPKVLDRVVHSRHRGGRPSPEKGLTVYTPLVAPPTSEIFRWLNRKVFVPRILRDLRRMAGPNPIVLAYPPTRTTLDTLQGLEPRLTVYDCVDYYVGYPGVPEDMAETERELLRRADLVSCTSTSLLERVKPVRPDAMLNGPGVKFEAFNSLSKDRIDGEIRIICYFGYIGRVEMDFSILKAIVRAGFTLRLIGDSSKAEKGLLEMSGVDYRGEVSHEKLPAALKGVDAFIIPYRVDELSRNVSPSKTYECLATGRPVVASPLPALVDLGEHVYLAEGPEGFVEVLRNLPRMETEERVRARIEVARLNSWEARFEELEEALWSKL
ncbi:MAG: glycosyltransferase [Actinobacteria bacterium]|nr:glycosyltransferase [Actinomycetota bacterium]MCA1739970.1 glycosyltransferase [Actinomycetota bacterium]